MDGKQIIIDAGKELLAGNLTVETWGNLSVRDPETGKIYLSPSGMDYTTCVPDDVVVLSPEGEILEGKRKPSVEKDLHLFVYAQRPDVCAIVHTHPVFSTIFGCLGEEIPLFLDEGAQALGGPVKTCAYALPGSRELAEYCAAALAGDTNACLLQSHGAVCVGGSMKEAFKVARVLEMSAEIYWRIRSLGREPLALDPKNIAWMRDFAKNRYGQR